MDSSKERWYAKIVIGVITIGFAVWLIPLPSKPSSYGFADLKISAEVKKSPHAATTDCQPDILPKIVHTVLYRTDKTNVKVIVEFFGTAIGFDEPIHFTSVLPPNRVHGTWFTPERVKVMRCLDFRFEFFSLDIEEIALTRIGVFKPAQAGQLPSHRVLDLQQLKRPMIDMTKTTFEYKSQERFKVSPRSFSFLVSCEECFRGVYGDYGYNLSTSYTLFGHNVTEEKDTVGILTKRQYHGKVIGRSKDEFSNEVLTVDLSDSNREYWFIMKLTLAGIIAPIGVGFIISAIRHSNSKYKSGSS